MFFSEWFMWFYVLCVTCFLPCRVRVDHSEQLQHGHLLIKRAALATLNPILAWTQSTNKIEETLVPLERPFTVLFPRSAEALGCGYASLPMLTSWLLNWQLWPPAPDLPSLQNLLLNHLNMFLPSHSIWETHTPWHPSPLFPLTYNSFVKYALNAALCIHSLTPFQFLLYPRLWWSLQQACSPSHTKFMSVITASASPPVIKVLHCHSQIHNGWK